MNAVRLVLEDMGQDYKFEYIDYSYAEYAVTAKRNVVSFPWRKTTDREKFFYFSRPLFQVETQVFYNRQANRDGLVADDLENKVFGDVEAYAYTGNILELMEAARARPNGTKAYPTEASAIRALLANEIDVLPLPASVVKATLQTLFLDQANLLETVNGVSDTFPLHLIAPRNPEGKAFIEAFNTSHARLTDLDILSPWNEFEEPVDKIPGEIAMLRAAEGFPVILGSKSKEADAIGGPYLVIPQGTRVLILEWSEAIKQPASTSQIYKPMTATTHVLILNGPHIAEELWVKNMHIAIVE